MDPIHLKPSEVDYELRIRNIIGLSSITTKIKTLRDILKNEALGIEINPADSSVAFTFGSELIECGRIIQTINETIDMAEDNYGSILWTEAEHRILHLKGRLKRVHVQDREDSNWLHGLRVDCDNLVRRIADGGRLSIGNKISFNVPSEKPTTSGVQSRTWESMGGQEDFRGFREGAVNPMSRSTPAKVPGSSSVMLNNRPSRIPIPYRFTKRLRIPPSQFIFDIDQIGTAESDSYLVGSDIVWKNELRDIPSEMPIVELGATSVVLSRTWESMGGQEIFRGFMEGATGYVSGGRGHGRRTTPAKVPRSDMSNNRPSRIPIPYRFTERLRTPSFQSLFDIDQVGAAEIDIVWENELGDLTRRETQTARDVNILHETLSEMNLVPTCNRDAYNDQNAQIRCTGANMEPNNYTNTQSTVYCDNSLRHLNPNAERRSESPSVNPNGTTEPQPCDEVQYRREDFANKDCEPSPVEDRNIDNVQYARFLGETYVQPELDAEFRNLNAANNRNLLEPTIIHRTNAQSTEYRQPAQSYSDPDGYVDAGEQNFSPPNNQRGTATPQLINEARYRQDDDPTQFEFIPNEFMPENNRSIMLEKITNRKQKASESIGAFLTFMQSQFMWLDIPIDDQHQVFIVRNNLLPKFAQKVAPFEIRTLGELAIVCRRVESATKSVSMSPLFESQNYSRNSLQRVKAMNEEYEDEQASCESDLFVGNGTTARVIQKMSQEAQAAAQQNALPRPSSA